MKYILAIIVLLFISCKGVLWDGASRTVSNDSEDITITIDHGFDTYAHVQEYLDSESTLTYLDWLKSNGLY